MERGKGGKKKNNHYHDIFKEGELNDLHYINNRREQLK